jgi:hypothetical protein
VLDVTGSNINFARLVYDKLPMFYGQIEQKNYLDDFELSICAVGDATCDKYPLQISDFAKGIELDSWMEKLVLEGGGGGGGEESYELAAHYLAKNTEFGPNSRPIVFFIGDEQPYPKVKENEALRFGVEYKEPTNGFDELKKITNNNVFMFLNKYCGREHREDFFKTWGNILSPQHVVNIDEEKAIVDQMLGTIASIGGRNLQQYALDMKDRGQTPKRIEGVISSLKELSKALTVIEQVRTNLPTSHDNPKTYVKGRRL